MQYGHGTQLKKKSFFFGGGGAHAPTTPLPLGKEMEYSGILPMMMMIFNLQTESRDHESNPEHH